MEFIKNLLAKLNGYKTYVLGVAGILTALGAYLNGAMTLQQLAEAVWASIMAMTIRHGVTTTVSDATGKKL